MLRPTRSPFRALLVLVLLLGLGSACTSETEPADVRTASNGDEFNEADVEFATNMIQHHAQALVMVDLTLGRDLDPALQALAEEIRAAQSPEIELMTDWLVAWDEKVPETMRDHANAHGDGQADHGDLPGMVTGEQLEALEAADDAQFEELWLELMVAHHQGAIEMAETQQDDGHHQPAVDLAGDIIDAQSAEISVMESMLG